MNYHKILGVTKNACKKTIREAYLKKVKLYHPDINKSSDATSKFKQIQEAYQALHNDDYSQKSYHSENPYSKSNKPEETKNKQNYNYSDDFSDFQRSFYEDVRKMRENERKEYHRRYSYNNYGYSMNDIFNKHPRDLKSHFKEKPILIYDSYGRAFLVDNHGRKFRASEFDKY
ncbi:DnaJ protein [Plasmodium brasilianum]|uniref:DnaJ protein n=1 Tax=Plasmodium brasilianum TaxID=5824 RepID=A0ACB9Y8G6_PLABR|nr:DnaJ protein [Plasmodium brasilianum]